MHHLGEIDWSEMEEADLRREFAPARRVLHPDPRDPAYDGPPEPDGPAEHEPPTWVAGRGICLCRQPSAPDNPFWCQACIDRDKARRKAKRAAERAAQKKIKKDSEKSLTQGQARL